jgi:hypothetical protein
MNFLRHVAGPILGTARGFASPLTSKDGTRRVDNRGSIMDGKRPLLHRKGLPAVLLGGLALAGFLAGASPAFAVNNCMQDITTAGGGGTLNCNSNDVRIAHVTNITPVTGITGNATDGFKCFSGAPIEFTADFEVDLGAQARYDIGLYIAQNQAQALSGTCNSSVITKSNAPVTFKQLDTSDAADTCGDITGALGTAFNPQIVHLDISTTCTAGTGTTKLALPNCTSWRQPGSNTTCTSINNAFPGSPSKCNCANDFTIDVNVETANLQVTKAVASTSPSPLFEPGGNVTYSLTVHNPAVALVVNLDKVTEDDTNDGTVDATYNASDVCLSTTLAACGSDPNNCASGSTTTCSFIRSVSGNAGDTFTDKACVTDTKGGGPYCDTATVKIQDVIPTAKVTKTFDSLQCSTVRYAVKVENLDTAESLTLTALNDDKVGGNGDLTSLHNNVLGTTCGVTGPGLGTMSGLTGSGALSTIAVSGNYSCKFDAKTCTTGQQTDVVTATLNDNDTNTITPNGSATVTITATTP